MPGMRLYMAVEDICGRAACLSIVQVYKVELRRRVQGMRERQKKGAQKEMIRNEIFGWLLKFWIIAVIGFLLFCLGRYFNHFPKHDERHAVKTTEAAREFNENLVELEQNATEAGYSIGNVLIPALNRIAETYVKKQSIFSKIATFLAVGPALFGYNIDKAKELLFTPAVSKKRLPGIGGVRSIKDMPFVFGGEAHKTASPAEVEVYEAVKNARMGFIAARRAKSWTSYVRLD